MRGGIDGAEPSLNGFGYFGIVAICIEHTPRALPPAAMAAFDAVMAFCQPLLFRLQRSQGRWTLRNRFGNLEKRIVSAVAEGVAGERRLTCYRCQQTPRTVLDKRFHLLVLTQFASGYVKRRNEYN